MHKVTVTLGARSGQVSCPCHHSPLGICVVQDRFEGRYEVGQGETVTILSRRDTKPELLLRDIHSKVVKWQYPIASLIIPLCAQQGTMSLELVETVTSFTHMTLKLYHRALLIRCLLCFSIIVLLNLKESILQRFGGARF